jgi:hypothetical protein
MKTTCVALATVVAVASAAPGPTTKTQRCVVAGDPHYTPFAAKTQEKDDPKRFTVMGTGEFVLAAKGDFSVHGCQADQSWDVRKFKQTKGAITWNQDIVAQQGTSKVEVNKAGEVYINDVAQPNWNTGAGWKSAKFEKTVGNVMVVQTAQKQLIAKFTDTGRMIKINYFNNPGTSKKDKFGPRSGLNVMVVTPEDSSYTGLCAEEKGEKPTHQVASADSMFKHSPTCSTTSNQVADKTPIEADASISEEIKALPCQALVRYAELACNNNQDCVYDTVVGCSADDKVDAIKKQDVIDMAEIYQPVLAPINKPYTCPPNSYVDTQSWPLVGFIECKCVWGYEKSADETCVKSAAAKETDVHATGNHATYGRAQCFCDPNQPRHCSHDTDFSCGLPVTVADQSVDCTNPSDALDASKCVCPTGTMDCSNTDFSLTQIQAPAFAQPKMPFGTQPMFELRNNGVAATNDDVTMARITIANVQPKDCGCAQSKPCKHNGVADNTCFEKQELFGEQVCPAGTTECLPAQADAMLFRNNLNDPTVAEKDMNCQNHPDTAEAGFCSGETPCKHQGKDDATCMPMTTFQPNVAEVEASTEKAKCRGTVDWRLAEPAPTRGWFFATDSSCDMTDASEATGGCTEAGHSYAMDKWCDHNCSPKAPGQEPFCPPSHCTCDSPDDVKAAPKDAAGWICPAGRMADGSCRCSAGTERCGEILVQAKKGVFSFEHLTIGTPGTYQLQVELVNPDQNTGSNNIQVTALTSTFEVAYPSEAVGECRAQDQWRIPDLPSNPKAGAGQAWFFEDDVARCTNLNADGTCQEVKQVFAMDTWCKANRCASHTLVSHCVVKAPLALLRGADKCSSEKFDAFGECCQSGRVDQCNVCDGDGTTCTIESYLSTFVADSATSSEVFDVAQGKSCPTHTPCAHLNVGDNSCVPKTFASSEKVNENFRYCYLNRPGQAPLPEGANDHWKKGTWDDVNGAASLASGTYEDGNTDCFCPKGTVDVSEKAAVEDQAEVEFIEDFKKKIEEVEEQIAAKAIDATMTKEMEQKKIMLENTEGGVKLYSNSCEEVQAGNKGKVMTITNPKAQPMCGMFWENEGKAEALRRTDWCFRTNHEECINDSVRCIEVPALTHVKTYIHCNMDQEGQMQYPTLTNNNPSAPQFFTPTDAAKVSRISVHGNVLTVQAQVQGTTSQAMDNTCQASADALTCGKDSTCREHMQAAQECSKDGGNVLACYAMNGIKATGAVGAAWKGLLTCYAKESTKSLGNLMKKFSFPKAPWAQSRRLAAGVTAAVRVTTGGNNGLIGTPSSSLSATGAAAKSGTASAGGAAGTASLGAGMTALIALVSVGAVVGAAVGMKKRTAQTGFSAGDAGAPKSLEVSTRGGAKEDATDIL